MRNFIFVCCLLSIVGQASAQSIFDTEPNNTMATASVIADTPGYFSAVGTGALNPAGDVDFYSIMVGSNDLLTAAITPEANGLTTPNIEAGIFDSSGNLVSFDAGSSGNGSQALVSYLTPTSGEYYIGVTGFGDDLFVGDHTQQGPYQIVVGVTPMATPEPSSFAAIGVGILALARRRRVSKGVAR